MVQQINREFLSETNSLTPVLGLDEARATSMTAPVVIKESVKGVEGGEFLPDGPVLGDKAAIRITEGGQEANVGAVKVISAIRGPFVSSSDGLVRGVQSREREVLHTVGIRGEVAGLLDASGAAKVRCPGQLQDIRLKVSDGAGVCVSSLRHFWVFLCG